MTTPSDLLARELQRDGSRPFITWYDVATGARVELSVATTANWVAKAAGYLADELIILPGDPVLIEPALHWITAVLLLAIWTVGGDAETNPAAGGERFEVALDGMGVALSRMVAAYPDVFAPIEPSGADLVANAPGDLPPGARLLTTLPLDKGAGIGWGLLAPLAVGGSVVYVVGADEVADIATSERATHAVGLDVPGLPRLC